MLIIFSYNIEKWGQYSKSFNITMKYGVKAVNLLFPETDDSLIFTHHNETLIPIQSLLLNSESFSNSKSFNRTFKYGVNAKNIFIEH